MKYTESFFNKVFAGKEFDLPLKWDGVDFSKTLNRLYSLYTDKLKTILNSEELEVIKKTTNALLETVNLYLDGSPADAFASIGKAMEILNQHPLKVYPKSTAQSGLILDDPLRLFRVRAIDSKKAFSRRELFHIPYNQRAKVSTNRYGIAGYPCLYLGTSLEQCCNEIYADPNKDTIVVSSFVLERNIAQTRLFINVIELGIKPQDFKPRVKNDITNYNSISKRLVPYDILCHEEIQKSYLIWYPLIAACSYIIANKKDPFVAEYIIPQLLMQWIRSNIMHENELYGIRHFSCASIKASDMGYTYVFPTSGEIDSDQYPYCPILTKAFLQTKPIYVSDYNSITECEVYLRSLDVDMDFESPRIE